MPRVHLLIATMVAAFVTLADAAPQDRPAFTAESELVVLHVTVKDRQGHYVAGLPKEAFRVFEDDRPQPVTLFTSEDAPVTVGLLIDNSGSMQGNRDLVLAAATDFVESSNARDEVFALVFNDDVRSALSAQTPFTSDAGMLREALSNAVAARGRTALYDAIADGQDYVSRGRYERKALVVVTDGGDNASGTTFQQILNRTEASNVVVHTVGIIDPLERDSDPRSLEKLASASGGVSFTPHDARQVADAIKRVALDIRSAYTLSYAPAATSPAGAFHRIRVLVNDPTGRPLVVRTRTGYMAAPASRGGSHGH